MCLSKVSKTHSASSDLIVDGWKEFTGSKPSLQFPSMGGAVALDTWMKATGPNIVASDGKNYAAGFHVYADENKGWRRTRVYVRRITAEGSQGTEKAIIAAEMFVPSMPDAWPPLSSASTAPPSSTPPKRQPKNVLSRLRQKPGGQS